MEEYHVETEYNNLYSSIDESGNQWVGITGRWSSVEHKKKLPNDYGNKAFFHIQRGI